MSSTLICTHRTGYHPSAPIMFSTLAWAGFDYLCINCRQSIHVSVYDVNCLFRLFMQFYALMFRSSWNYSFLFLHGGILGGVFCCRDFGVSHINYLHMLKSLEYFWCVIYWNSFVWLLTDYFFCLKSSLTTLFNSWSHITISSHFLNAVFPKSFLFTLYSYSSSGSIYFFLLSFFV